MATPKLIHQIWLQGWSNLPTEFKANVQSVIDKNPDWKHMQWDDKYIIDTVTAIGPEYLAKYNSFKLIHQRVDFGRYAILYMYGGVSVDIDALALRSFNFTPHLSDSDFIVSNNSRDSFVNNATIFVSEKNPLMKDLLDSIGTDCTGMTDSSCILNTAGITAFNKFVQAHKDSITILPNTYFEPCSGRDKHCIPGPLAILDHQHSGTWVSPVAKFIMEGYYNAKQNRRAIFGIVSLLIIVVIFVKIVK